MKNKKKFYYFSFLALVISIFILSFDYFVYERPLWLIILDQCCIGVAYIHLVSDYLKNKL